MVTSKHGISLVLALGVTATGCSSSSPGQVNDNPDAGVRQSDAPVAPLSLNGTYAVASTYDLSTNAPGIIGQITDDFIAITAGPNAPSQWILDQIIAAMAPGAAQTALQLAESVLVSTLNQQLLSYAPTFAKDILRVGDDFGQAAKHFGTVDQFVVSVPNLTHNVIGAHFTIEGTSADYLFATYNVATTTANANVSMDANASVSIAKHNLPIPYGSIMQIALDAAILPAIEPGSHDLTSFLEAEINCTSMGAIIANQLGFGDAATYAVACTAGLQFGAAQLEAEIAKIDAAALTFEITGTALAVDKNADHNVDILSNGVWAGTLIYATAPSQLNPATFTGTRQ